MPDEKTNQKLAEKATAQQAEEQRPTRSVEETEAKFPEFVKLRDSLTKERETIVSKAAPHRQQREELVKQIQPLETKLREVNQKIIDIEQPRLSEIDTQLGRIAVAMGGRSIHRPEETRS